MTGGGDFIKKDINYDILIEVTRVTVGIANINTRYDVYIRYTLAEIFMESSLPKNLIFFN